MQTKFIRLRLCLFFVSAIIAASLLAGELAGRAVGQEHKAPRTIVEYFKLLPEKYCFVSQQRKADILRDGTATIDVRNGFMEYSDSAESKVQLALFMTPQRDRLLAVSFTGDEFDQRTQDIADANHFYVLKPDAKWTDVTALVFPNKLTAKDRVELPRLGTTIVVHPEKGAARSFAWSGGRFRPK